MNFFGDHGTQAVADIFLFSALPFSFLIWFEKRFHPDTFFVIALIYTLLNVPGNLFLAITSVIHHQWAFVPLWLFFIVANTLFMYLVWKKWRKRRKPSLKKLGAKSKALLDKLVERVRQAQPEGAR